MATTKKSHLVSLLLSLVLMILFISSQFGLTEARRNQRKWSPSQLTTPPPPSPPPPPFTPPPPFRPPPPQFYVPPSKSRRGKGS
ncbi:unnamed protein product [Cochlearia groenlandica]